MKAFLMFLFLSGSVFAYELPELGYFAQWQKTGPIQNNKVALFVHSSDAYDHKAQSERAVIKMLEHLRSDSVSTEVISLVHNIKKGGELARSYYMTREDIDIPIRSQYGNHHLNLTSLKSLILAGGYFEICFKNAFRDVLQKSFFPDKELDVSFVTDGIYAINPLGGSAISLKKKVSSMTKKKLLHYLNNSFMEQKDLMYHMRRNQQMKKRMKDGVRLKYYLKGKLIQSTGSGNFTVNINLTQLESFISNQK